MKKYLMTLVAVLVAVAVAVPAFAVEFKYGGLYRLRLQSQDNIADGRDKQDGAFDDNGLWIDQRLRMFFTFVASERLQVVTKWEADTVWGNQTGGRHGGGGVGADEVNLEMKNVYVDFMIPNTPTRATLGVQGIALLSGWIVDDDFSAAVLSTPLDPVFVQLGYIAARNENVTDHSDNIDDWFINVGYAQGPLKASLVGFYQYGHDRAVSTPFAEGTVTDNHLFDLGFSLAYEMDMLGAWVNFVKNFGSYDYLGDSTDYTGWMVEAAVNFFVQNFTFTVGGFYTSGDDNIGDSDNNFRYPAGVSHYWSEIMGLGTLDVSVSEPGTTDRMLPQNKGNYRAADAPSNLWTVTAGAAWQALEATKLTFNYYYIGTSEKVISDFVTGDTSSSIGHELNLYIDQAVVDGLNLRLVGAYLFANDAYTIYSDDDDAYELGARLQWAF